MLKSYEEMRKVDVKPYLEKRDGMDYLSGKVFASSFEEIKRK